MTDVRLYHGADGGEIDYVNGRVSLSNGLETAVYLSLFGGNEEDSGLQGDDPAQWWANLSETDPNRRYRSETQNLLRGIPAVPANLLRIEQAATRDLAWMLETGLAANVGVRATIPALNRITITVNIEIDGEFFPFEFTEQAFVK